MNTPPGTSMQDALNFRNKLQHYVDTGEYPVTKHVCRKCTFVSLLNEKETKCEFCGYDHKKMEVEE